MEWPQSFYAMRGGEGCPICAEGRPDDAGWGVRFFAGAFVDAYLTRTSIQRGYSIVTWRGRHVAEPADLDEDEAAAYWRELLHVGRGLQAVLGAVKMNYETLGNSLPHLHTHVIPRYADDPRPGWPFPFPEDDSSQRDEAGLRADAEALRAALGHRS